MAARVEPAPASTEAALDAAVRAARCLVGRQQYGHWPADYGGPLFLLPGLVIARYVTRAEWSETEVEGLLAYLWNTQNPDGGWGLHVEGDSTVLGTTLNYVAARLLGTPAHDPRAERARRRLHELGGAEGVPTWGKFYLCLLGVYDWEGINPLPPELWLLPRWFPLHPARFWCHTRAVFLPMSALYGRRFVAEEDDVIRALRTEVFVTRHEEIDWPALRERIAPGDVYTPHSRWLKFFNRLLGLYERRPIRALRQHALRRAGELIRYEDEHSGYLTIGPVSKALHLVAYWSDDPHGPAFRRHLERVPDYLWDGPDGLKVKGYNGSQLWDVAHAVRALLCFRESSGAGSPDVDAALESAFRYLDAQQVRQNLPQHWKHHRDATAGGWPFSTAEQGWIVSDCTGEALQAALGMQSVVERPLPLERLERAILLLLNHQNPDGGWSEYERSRGSRFLEQFNAAEVFGDVMIGYSCTECTSSCIQGLVAFRRRHPDRLRRRIDRAVARGVRFVRRRQRPNGGFYGSWGVCFTYGTRFAVEGLLAAGVPASDPAIRSAAEFLLERQREDGAWGEAFASCVEQRYVQHERGQAVQTAWAMLALAAVYGQEPSPRLRTALERGAAFLAGRQRDDGGWDRESLAGVFNRNCAIDYDNYRFVFPLWALARFARVVTTAGA